MNEETQKKIQHLEETIKEQQGIINGMLLHSAFTYGMAAAGDPLAIKLLELTKRDDPKQWEYVVSMKEQP